METLTKNLAYLFECFNRLRDYQIPVEYLKKQGFFSNLKMQCPPDIETEQTKGIMKEFNTKNGEKLTRLYLKTDVLLLACVFEKFIRVSINEFGISPLYCVSLPGYA